VRAPRNPSCRIPTPLYSPTSLAPEKSRTTRAASIRNPYLTPTDAVNPYQWWIKHRSTSSCTRHGNGATQWRSQCAHIGLLYMYFYQQTIHCVQKKQPFLFSCITHSLVDLPRWGLATADDHSNIFLLHCARSCDIFSWMYSQPVHCSMSCIRCLLGLPWCRNSSMIPSWTVSANCPALPRVIWPKYCSFSFATLPVNSLSRPNSVNIELFARCSCHEMFFFSNTTFQMLLFCFCPISSKFIPPLHTRILLTPLTSPLWLSLQFLYFGLQILASTTAFCLANAMRLLISLV